MTNKEALLQMCEFAYSQSRRKLNTNWWGNSSIWHHIINIVNSDISWNKIKKYISFELSKSEHHYRSRIVYVKVFQYIKEIDYQDSL